MSMQNSWKGRLKADEMDENDLGEREKENKYAKSGEVYAKKRSYSTYFICFGHILPFFLIFAVLRGEYNIPCSNKFLTWKENLL